jgi:squalene synthase HpnC
MWARTGRAAVPLGEEMGDPVPERSATQRRSAVLPGLGVALDQAQLPGVLTPDLLFSPESAAASQAVAAKAAFENFPVALRMLPRTYRRHLMAVYVFARTADDIGDEIPVAERLQRLAELEADVRALYSRGQPALAAVAGLKHTAAECEIPMQPFIDLIRANQQDQLIKRYETYEDLAGYCRLSANPVGRIVLYVFGSFSAARGVQSDYICTGLQLAEHWQDVAEDFRAGRIYLPLTDMAAHGCTERDLAAPHAAPQLRELMAFEVSRARSLIDAGAPLIGTLRGAARAAVAGYVAGGRAALAAIQAVDYDVLAVTPRPGKARTAIELATALARGR